MAGPSGNLGWVAGTTILPRRPNAIDEVGKASMVDLHAALYQTDATRTSSDPAVRAAEGQRRKQLRTTTDKTLGRGGNSGVDQRNAADERAEADAEAKRQEAMERKAQVYEKMQRGEEMSEKESAACLVDFELKQLGGGGGSTDAFHDARRGGSGSATDGREDARLEWERRTREDMGRGPSDARPDGAKRLADELAVGQETAVQRTVAAEQKSKRQKTLDERRAMIRQKQESRERAAQPEQLQQQEVAPALASSSAPATALAPLPPGWSEANHPTTGRTYYYMQGTNHTQWKRPEPLPPPPPPPPPPPMMPPPPPPMMPPMPPYMPPMPPHMAPPMAPPQPPPGMPPPAAPPTSRASWPTWQQQLHQRGAPPAAQPAQANSNLSPEEAMMASMGLPSGFTSAVAQQQAREEEEAAREAQVAIAWARYSPKAQFAPPWP